MTITRQQRRAVERRLAKAKAALSVDGEARDQAVLEQKRKMGRIQVPRAYRRAEESRFNKMRSR